MNLLHTPIAELVARHPQTAGVLHQYFADVPQDRATSLETLLGDHPARADILRAIQNLVIAAFCDQCQALDTPALIELIVKQFHNAHEAQMSGLIDQARYIERKYLDHDSCPVGLTELLMDFFDDLAVHMRQEELFFFPALIKAGNGNLFSQLAVFHHSHDRHQNMTEQLCSLTNNLVPPANAPDKWRQLYDDLAEFAFQLQLHIAIENRFLLND